MIRYVSKKIAAQLEWMFGDLPHTEEEANTRRTSMATYGNYPLGMTDCDVIGISGGCGQECCQFLRGECIEPWEIIEEIKLHQPLTDDMDLLIIEYEEAHEKAVKEYEKKNQKEDCDDDCVQCPESGPKPVCLEKVDQP